MTEYEKHIARIDEVAAHLFHRASHTTIREWLKNFKEEDRETALRLLGYMNFFTTDRVYASLRYSLEQLLKATPYGKIKILGVRDIGDEKEGIFGGQSGHMISYYAKKAAKAVNEDRIKVVSEEHLKTLKETHPNRQYTIVLLDDIFGTGDTVVEYYKAIKDDLISDQWKTVAIAVAYMPVAAKKLNRLNITVYGEQIISIFQAIRDAGMEDSKTEPTYKKLAIKYGKKLYKATEGNIKTLGYKNSQALVGFDYGVPNNTLPIIWSSKNENPDGEPWHPIFARNIEDRLDLRRRNSDYIQRWLCMAHKNGIHLKDKNGENIKDGITIQLYMILAMLEKGKNEVIITNFLDISMGDYEMCIEKARFNKLIDSLGKPTEKAYMALAEINAMKKRQERINLTTFNKKIYLPD